MAKPEDADIEFAGIMTAAADLVEAQRTGTDKGTLELISHLKDVKTRQAALREYPLQETQTKPGRAVYRGYAVANAEDAAVAFAALVERFNEGVIKDKPIRDLPIEQKRKSYTWSLMNEIADVYPEVVMAFIKNAKPTGTKKVLDDDIVVTANASLRAKQQDELAAKQSEVSKPAVKNAQLEVLGAGFSAAMARVRDLRARRSALRGESVASLSSTPLDLDLSEVGGDEKPTRNTSSEATTPAGLTERQKESLPTEPMDLMAGLTSLEVAAPVAAQTPPAVEAPAAVAPPPTEPIRSAVTHVVPQGRTAPTAERLLHGIQPLSKAARLELEERARRLEETGVVPDGMLSR
jgi:hypothetical protein